METKWKEKALSHVWEGERQLEWARGLTQQSNLSELRKSVGYSDLVDRVFFLDMQSAEYAIY